MPSPERNAARPARGVSAALWRKEVRELLLSRAFGLLLVAVGLLVGHAFITAVETYAEMSGAGGGASALPQGLSPLDGILVPTFGSYDLLGQRQTGRMRHHAADIAGGNGVGNNADANRGRHGGAPEAERVVGCLANIVPMVGFQC